MRRPAVVLANEGFVIDGRSAASSKGMPGVRLVAETVPCECSVEEDVEAGVERAIGDIVAALTRPLSDGEANPRPRESGERRRIAFSGELREINRFFYKRGWGDGLPLVPPTQEAVSEMLAGTDLPPEHLVGKLVPRGGKATVERIAINAVMAGALPTHLPVILACVEAMLEPSSGYGTFNVSTGSWAPFWIVNGPVRRDLHVNSGSGALSPGDIANAAIGRAIGLIVQNIGGARKGVEDMGVLGNPLKYSSVLAENEESAPWAPLHADAGYARETSAVTLFYPNCYSQIWPYGSDDRGILDAIVYNLQPGRGGLTCLILTPEHARVLARKGWTKKMIQSYVAEYARVPAYRHRNFHDRNSGLVKPGTVPMNPMDSMAIVRDPDHVRIVVAGGPGAFLGIACSASIGDCRFVTRPVSLPRGWDTLVARHRNVVPAYERY